MDKVSMSHLISFSRYQTKCVLSSYLDSWWPHKLLRFFLNQPMAHREKKNGRQKYTNLNISRTKRAF